ncbi:MAG TPA: sortase [Actinomycetota bacterium]|nr:sortase [Actinomycetota bacterium]
MTAAAPRAARLAETLRTRPGPRRALNVLSILLLVGGIALFAQPFITNLYANWRQSSLQDQLGSAANRNAYAGGALREGDPVTRLRIPKLGVDTIVVEGTTLSALRAGSGHYVQTPLPCEPGNSAIAGHRTTYSKPFARTHELERGDRIVLDTPVGRCVYRVHDTWVTLPTDATVLAPARGSWLTLTTCDPPGSARERLIVRAKLVRSTPA